MLSKIRTERAAGKILFDVIYGGVAPLLTSLNVLQPYARRPRPKPIRRSLRTLKDYGRGFGANPDGLELFPVPVKVQLGINQYAEKFEKIFGPRR
jgi:hypothetical protein